MYSTMMPEPVLVSPATDVQVTLIMDGKSIKVPMSMRSWLTIGDKVYVHGIPATEWSEEIHEGMYKVVGLEPYA